MGVAAPSLHWMLTLMSPQGLSSMFDGRVYRLRVGPTAAPPAGLQALPRSLVTACGIGGCVGRSVVAFGE